MRKYSITSCIALLYLLCVTHGRIFSKGNRKQTSNEFDVLIFTQQWPLTSCFLWKKDSGTRSCVLPKRDEWTIHGIWPTKYNTLNPQFCNRSLEFNPDALAPIESKLKEVWLDIHKGSIPYSFWKHEWDKHGTCAITIKTLNNEFNYFQEGLILHDKYNMMNILGEANILPGNNYMIQEMLTGMQKVLGKKGQIMCATNEKTGESYVFEIRICLNKALQLVDCDGIYQFPTNCDSSKKIIYPSRVPQYYVTQI